MVVIISIYDKNYKRIGFLSNESEKGISFEKDVLTTTIDSGVYTLSMTIPKITPDASLLQEGNYIEMYTQQGKQLLMMIVRSTENRGQRDIFCEDGNIQALNNYAGAIESPTSPQEIDYYISHTLEGTGYELKTNQSTEPKIIEFTSDQRILERLREIAKTFELELDFDIEFKPGEPPLRYVNFYNKRIEGTEGFRISSDTLVYGMERQRNIYNIATRAEARGRQKETDTSVSTGTPPPTTDTPGSDVNWSPQIVDRRNSAMGGQANNRSRSAITHIAWHYTAVARANNRTIESHEAYWRDTHGWDRGGYHYYINSQGVLHWNYNYERTTWGVADNNDYTVHISLEGNSATDFSEAQLKARDWITRKIMNELSIDPNNVMQHREFPGNSGQTCSGYTLEQMNQFRQQLGGTPSYSEDVPSDVDVIAEKVIAEAFRIKKLKLPYQWGGNGNPSYDCSGFVQHCYKVAGLNPSSAGWPRATTYSMWAQDGKFRRITKDKLKPGDLLMYDTGYTTPGDVNHVGIYLGPTLDAPNSVCHAGNPVGLVQRANSMTIIGYVTVLR